MIDTAGHLIHIDFGFVFGLAPGKQFSMETAPWKLTEEMADVMGGVDSPDFERYITLTTQAFKLARTKTTEVLKLMEIMACQSSYPAFKYNANAITDLESRMMLDVSDGKLEEVVRGFMTR
jgi:phosphatidylinositol 4-kinase